MTQRLVLPVIHFLDVDTAISQADLAFAAGADGVFLISHNGQDSKLAGVARGIKTRHASKLVGLNYLSLGAVHALHLARKAKVDMVWADTPGVFGNRATWPAYVLSKALQAENAPLFFGSVAFKYQPYEPDPAGAAVRAAQLGMLPTTSGGATGHAPEVAKARCMSEALQGGPLAIASGMTPVNAHDYLPYFTHFLVATGVSRDMHHFDEELLADFVRKVHAYQTPDNTPQ